MASNITNIKKLQRAINARGEKLLYNTNQWYSDRESRPVTIHSIKKAVWDDDLQKTVNVELFKSTSMIQILLFLRDYWYEMNGMTLPMDNEEWNTIRDSIRNANDTSIEVQNR